MGVKDIIDKLPQSEPGNSDDTATRRIEAVRESLRMQRQMQRLARYAGGPSSGALPHKDLAPRTR